MVDCTKWCIVPSGVLYQVVYCTKWCIVPSGVLYQVVYCTKWCIVPSGVLYQVVYCTKCNNRITSQGALCIAKGLEGNNTLEVLKIGSNPIGSEGLVSILKAILSYCDSALVHIHCQCDTLYNELRKIKNFTIYPMPGVGGKDPSRAVRRYAEANQQQWMEAFQEYDTDGLYKVTRADFVKGIKKSGLQFDIEETARLLKQLDPKKENLVSYMLPKVGLRLVSGCQGLVYTCCQAAEGWFTLGVRLPKAGLRLVSGCQGLVYTCCQAAEGWFTLGVRLPKAGLRLVSGCQRDKRLGLQTPAFGLEQTQEEQGE
ncbi:predicted protein [Nematostella vectensis]|uniref:EF-hand domain-containing protein n=1 Tax=Nematostella vectensis TaxID=45351 RepID=A7SEL4_NEMVE|nr:predicted protein [Nematostella vectensis]|eukprot:XP_001629899.1 predicted protein [Nematostella vectensis]